MTRVATPILTAAAILVLSAAPTNASRSVKAKHPKITALTVTISGRHIKMSAVIAPGGAQTNYSIWIYAEPEKCPRKPGEKCELDREKVEEKIAPVSEGTITAGAEPRELHAASEGDVSRAHPFLVKVTAENEAGGAGKSKRVK